MQAVWWRVGGDKRIASPAWTTDGFIPFNPNQTKYMNRKYYCSKKRVQDVNGLTLMKCDSKDWLIVNTLEFVLKHGYVLHNISFYESLYLVESRSTTTQTLFKTHSRN